MERRQFLKTAMASAAVPMIPGGIAKAAPYSPAQYARAVKIASGGAFLSAKYLEFYFGVTASASEAMVKRLVSDGILSSGGIKGVMFSKAFNASRTPVVAKLAYDVSAAQARADAAALKKRALETLENIGAQDEPETDAEDETSVEIEEEVAPQEV